MLLNFKNFRNAFAIITLANIQPVSALLAVKMLDYSKSSSRMLVNRWWHRRYRADFEPICRVTNN